MSQDLKATLEAVCAGQDLSSEHTRELFEDLVQGNLSEIHTTAFLIALKAKGETPQEIAGAAQALRAAAHPFDRPEYAFADCCGTGGDGQGTINVSTAAAFVVSALGLPVAKHGNRSVSSKCGSADVLAAVGAKIDPRPEVSRKALDTAGICFFFAPQYHAGLRHAMPVRKTLGTRTIMNLLGPLVNPARPPIQLIGLYRADLVVPVAKTLALLGLDRALVVHGSGLDELALHGPTEVAKLEAGEVETMTLRPQDAGLSEAPLTALAGGAPEDNAKWLRGLLGGDGDRVHRDAVALNAGGLGWAAGKYSSLRDGVEAAQAVLSGQQGLERLNAFVEATHGG